MRFILPYQYKKAKYGYTLLLFLFFILASNLLTAQCSITLKPTVSGCYQNAGSKATVRHFPHNFAEKGLFRIIVNV
jgi:hypothetical protein